MRPDLPAEVWLWPLRGTTWDLFETGHSVEIQKVDSPDVDGRTFETDDAAAGYVVMHAQWEENPNVLLRDQCRAVLDELVYSWGGEEG